MSASPGNGNGNGDGDGLGSDKDGGGGGDDMRGGGSGDEMRGGGSGDDMRDGGGGDDMRGGAVSSAATHSLNPDVTGTDTVGANTGDSVGVVISIVTALDNDINIDYCKNKGVSDNDAADDDDGSEVGQNKDVEKLTDTALHTDTNCESLALDMSSASVGKDEDEVERVKCSGLSSVVTCQSENTRDELNDEYGQKEQIAASEDVNVESNEDINVSDDICLDRHSTVEQQSDMMRTNHSNDDIWLVDTPHGTGWVEDGSVSQSRGSFFSDNRWSYEESGDDKCDSEEGDVFEGDRCYGLSYITGHNRRYVRAICSELNHFELNWRNWRNWRN